MILNSSIKFRNRKTKKLTHVPIKIFFFILGVSFSEEESYRISLSLRKLAKETNATQLRFWGKILCSEKDYYIAEAVTPSQFAD